MKVALLFLFVFSVSSFAATLTMQEHDIALNTADLKDVFVRGDGIRIRSSAIPCPYYPKGIYGDLYECYTSRIQLAALLKNPDILNFTPEQIAAYLATSSVEFVCNTEKQPEKINMNGNVLYYFVGGLKTLAP